MKLNRKVTDFIRLEEGNIGRKSAVVTGALLTSTVLGAVLASTVEAHCNQHIDNHSNHYDHANSGYSDHMDGQYCP